MAPGKLDNEEGADLRVGPFSCQMTEAKMAFRMFSREGKPQSVPERKASATGRVVAFASGGGRTVWSARVRLAVSRGGLSEIRWGSVRSS